MVFKRSGVFLLLISQHKMRRLVLIVNDVNNIYRQTLSTLNENLEKREISKSVFIVFVKMKNKSYLCSRNEDWKHRIW